MQTSRGKLIVGLRKASLNICNRHNCHAKLSSANDCREIGWPISEFATRCWLQFWKAQPRRRWRSICRRGSHPSNRVRQDMEDTQRLYDEQASQRLANVATLARRSIIKLITVLLCTAVLVSAFVWVLQKSKVTSTLQLARTQMNFAASVSHELRTPLAVLCSAVDNIADGVVTGKEQFAKYGSVIRNQSRQINALVNQVTLFASTQDRDRWYVRQPLAVKEVIEVAVAGTTELIHKNGFALEQHVQPDLPNVMGDLPALSQCLQNLVTNALKYGEEGRWISISAHAEESKDSRGREVRISVQDRGKGIDRSELPRIFEPFYRSPAAVAGQVHGTGLGLPIAKSIAEAMGGRLSVKSEFGVGSVFTVHLPVGNTRDESQTVREAR